MNPWIEAEADPPPVNEIVEVSVQFGPSGIAQLRGYRLASRAGAESLWLNALTHEPFPDGWRITRWKKAEGLTVAHAGEPTASR
jgi:hypothetical protein